MSTFLPLHRSPALLVGLLLAGLLLAGGAVLPAQNPAKKKDEVEDPKPVKVKKVTVDDDEPVESGPKKPADASDLRALAREARHPAVKEYLDSLAVPHDEVTVSSGNTYPIDPISENINFNKDKRPKYKHETKWLDPKKDWRPAGRMIIDADQVLARYVPYEELAQRKTDEFLAQGPPDALAIAETALARVARFHEDERAERGRRQGPTWKDVEEGLRRKMLDVRLRQLDDRVSKDDWPGAFAQAQRLASIYTRTEDRLLLGERLAVSLKRALERPGLDYGVLRELRGQLQQLSDEFPESPTVKEINGKLRDQAAKLHGRAQDLEKKKPPQPREALDLLRQALEIWPRLPGLRDDYLRLSNTHGILRVGVRDLPEKLSPPLAFTDSERMAVELLYEGLVKLSPDGAGGLRYQPGLSEGRPRLVPLGRQFTLARQAYWSNGKPVTAADVSHTVQLLFKDPKWTYYNPAWAALIDGARVGEGPHQVSVTLSRGFVDPLSLMTFKVLPAQPYADHPLKTADDASLASATVTFGPEGQRSGPVGSGPFLYKGRDTSFGRSAAVFAANPYHRKEPGTATLRAGARQIREVHFFRSDDPVKDFREGHLDLLLEPPLDKMKEVLEAKKERPFPDVQVLAPLPNRRIWFLAVNHRSEHLKDHAGVKPGKDPGRLLRRAIALAINRPEVLDECFRLERREKAHRPLNGPYPPDSWASRPGLPMLDDLPLAKTLIKNARANGLNVTRLSLKYANDDPQAKEAMALIKKQLEEIGIELDLQAVLPHRLRQQVEETHQYELAYYRYDFPSEAYWLWPLFDPRGTGSGRGNYLGYANDSQLASLFGQAMSHRDFNEVRRLTHSIHDVLHEKVPLIPLWQLDTRVALHPDLKTPPFDPLLVFPDIDQWQLVKK